jgi:hypothetical protein
MSKHTSLSSNFHAIEASNYCLPVTCVKRENLLESRGSADGIRCAVDFGVLFQSVDGNWILISEVYNKNETLWHC